MTQTLALVFHNTHFFTILRAIENWGLFCFEVWCFSLKLISLSGNSLVLPSNTCCLTVFAQFLRLCKKETLYSFFAYEIRPFFFLWIFLFTLLCANIWNVGSHSPCMDDLVFREASFNLYMFPSSGSFAILKREIKSCNCFLNWVVS